MAENTRIIIFAGAGASRAVDPDAFPTTLEFFERLPDEIKESSDFRFVVEYLRSNQPDRQVDIEEVLWNLQRLLSFFTGLSRPKDILSYSFQNSRVAKLSNSAYNFGHIDQVRISLSSSLSALISKINAIVYDFYGQTVETEKLENNWLKLLRSLLKYDATTDIFTTNYDINIETALENGMNTQEVDNILGLKGRRHKVLAIENWQSSERKEGLLTKLHGSLDWKFKNEAIYVGDPIFTGDHNKQAIIYPGFKGASGKLFFKPFHDYFERRIAEAKVVIFIGFAFRDDYINESIVNNLGSDATVIVVDPSKLVNFPYKRTKASYIRGYFDQESVGAIDKLLAKVLPILKD